MNQSVAQGDSNSSRLRSELLFSWAEATTKRTEKEGEMAAAAKSHENHCSVTDEATRLFNLDSEAVNKGTDDSIIRLLLESRDLGVDVGDVGAMIEALEQRRDARGDLVKRLNACLDHASE
jgi:hypothetical protein